MNRYRGFVWALLIALVAAALAACGGDDDGGNGGGVSETPAGGPETSEGGLDYGSLSGNVDVDGSSTVFPISQAMAEEFSQVSNVRVNVALSGTGGGFEKFCRGEIQISDASRPIKESEIEACAANGIDDIVEFYVAIDALTVVVNPRNDWVQCLTVSQLRQIFSEPQPQRWSEVDPSFPDERLITYYPGPDSGTFDYFVEAIIGEDGVHTSSGTSSEDDNVLVAGVEGDRGAIGYFGFAYYQEAGQGLRAVAIDNEDGDGCVEPTYENAATGRYEPLSRPLFIYTRESFLRERPEVLGFVKFYLENLNEIVPAVGYVAIPEEDLQEQLAKLEPYLQ